MSKQFIVLYRDENNNIQTVLNNDGRSLKTFGVEDMQGVVTMMASAFQVVEIDWQYPP